MTTKNMEEEPKGWTTFWDVHSGGTTKQEPFQIIYIEAAREEAIRIFMREFGHHPEEVGCSCCGVNYLISEEVSFEQASGYHRHCKFVLGEGVDGVYVEEPDRNYGRGPEDYETPEKHEAREDVLVVRRAS